MAVVTNTANVANREKTMIRVCCPPSAPVEVSVMLSVLGVVTADSGAVRICCTNHNRSKNHNNCRYIIHVHSIKVIMKGFDAILYVKIAEFQLKEKMQYRFFPILYKSRLILFIYIANYTNNGMTYSLCQVLGYNINEVVGQE